MTADESRGFTLPRTDDDEWIETNIVPPYRTPV
jgi:hypothetical protein